MGVEFMADWNKCPKCEHTIQSREEFCPECGEGLTIRCKNCGESWRSYYNFKFCRKCGTPAKKEK